MSTYLQLCTYLRSETTDAGTGPTAVTGNTGELARMVKWVADAWTELQQDREDWLWMRKSFTVDTVASDGAYEYTDCTDTVSAAAISRFARWYTGPEDWKCYLTSTGVSGEYFLPWLEWEDFKRLYRFGTQTNGPPAHVSMDPTQAFVLGPKPDAIYTISGDYQTGPQVMTADGDEPEMPARFHALIVYEAMSKYGGTRVAPEAMLRAVSEGGRLRFALELDQLPRMSYGAPLA